MGLEAECEATHQGRRGRGRALLETDEVLFRGDFRVSVPLKSITNATAKDGVLVVSFNGGPLWLALGERAETWRDRILRPKTLVERLGIRAGQSVVALGLTNRAVLDGLHEAAGKPILHNLDPSADVVIHAAEAKTELEPVADIARQLPKAAALWIVYPKGRQEIREADVLDAGRRAGLVDVKVVRFSETHTALKFVWPKTSR